MRPGDVLADFHQQGEIRGESYRQSFGGKLHSAYSEIETARSRQKLNELVTELPEALKGGMDKTLDWLKNYADLADYVGTDVINAEVNEKLKKAGYKNNDYVDDKFIDGDKEIMGRYIIGQAINCMDSGFSPHPNITPHFIEQYYNDASIQDAAKKAVTQAKAESKSTTLQFNGVNMQITPQTKLSRVVHYYRTHAPKRT